MLGARFHGCNEAEDLALDKSISHNEIRQFRLAHGQCAGLVEGDHRDLLQALQGFPPPKQNSQFGGASGADHDGGRGRKPHGARACDDQDRDGVHEREGQSRLRTEDCPGSERHRRQRHHGGNEPTGDPVDQGLNRQLRALRPFHHADDLRQNRIGADLRGAKRQSAGLVDSASDHGSAGRLRNRRRLPGDHGFIHIRSALDDVAVDRNLFARPHLNKVAQCDLFDRYVDDVAVALDPGRFGLEADKPLDRFRRPALRPGFKKASQEDQGDDDRRSLVINVGSSGRQP